MGADTVLSITGESLWRLACRRPIAASSFLHLMIHHYQSCRWSWAINRVESRKKNYFGKLQFVGELMYAQSRQSWWQTNCKPLYELSGIWHKFVEGSKSPELDFFTRPFPSELLIPFLWSVVFNPNFKVLLKRCPSYPTLSVKVAVWRLASNCRLIRLELPKLRSSGRQQI